MAFVTRMSILQELPRAVQNISQLLEKFFEKAEQENYPNAAFARRTARSRQVPHIALKQRRRVPRYASRRLKGNMGCMVTQNMLNHSRYEPICFSLLKNGWATRIPGRATRAPTPQAKAFGRIPKNCPLGSFLDGIPPHRFESPQPDQKTKQARQSPDL